MKSPFIWHFSYNESLTKSGLYSDELGVQWPTGWMAAKIDINCRKVIDRIIFYV